jgi:hypothetical protein
MGAVLAGERESLLPYGAGIALLIAALGLFVGVRAWSLKLGKETVAEAGGWQRAGADQNTTPQEAEGTTAGGE